VHHVFISPGGINPIGDIFYGLESYDITYIIQSLDMDLYEYDRWRPSIKPILEASSYSTMNVAEIRSSIC